MRRILLSLAAASTALAILSGPAAACGGLIGPNGAVNLLRTTTFVGYHAGVEHYVTAFQFAGGGGAFGSLTPLPGVPSDVERGGDWTLQRLVKEVPPPPVPLAAGVFAAPAEDRAEVLLETRIDALDITVLKGGADEVGQWAKDHGFRLPPDAPEVLDFYAQRSPIFLAASFDADAARERGQAVGDGTPVHITIPTPNPWVPLRILALGKASSEFVDADVFLMTDRAPALLPAPSSVEGFDQTHSAPATEGLLDDLRSDKGMGWVPQSAWLTKLSIDSQASNMDFDLAIDASGQGTPSRVAAGLDPLPTSPTPRSDPMGPVLAIFVGGFVLLGMRFGRSTAGPGQRPSGA